MKATKAQIDARVEEILRIRLDGAEIWDVREYVREKGQEKGSVWELPPDAKPLSDSQLWRYIAKADKLIADSCRASRKKRLRRHLAQRRNLYAKAVIAGDHRAALAVLADEAKLLGLYPPTDSAALAEIARLEKRLNALPCGQTETGPDRRPADGTGGSTPATGPLPGPGGIRSEGAQG
jgi:hypothetical protein